MKFYPKGYPLRLKSITLLLAAATLLILGGCGEKKSSSTHTPAQNPDKKEAPKKRTAFILKGEKASIAVKVTDKGADFNVSEPIVLVDLFATWCPPCRAEIPHLADLQKRYSGKVKVIGVLIETKFPAELRRFEKGFGINYFVANGPDNLPFAYTMMDMLHQSHNFSIPFMIMFVKGKYFRHYMGLVPEEMLESDIKEALKEVK